MDDRTTDRRPVAARGRRWAIVSAAWLAKRHVRPNHVSLVGLVAAALAGGCLLLSGRVSAAPRVALLVAAAGLVELRLLCNLLDGMIAIEGGRRSPSGPVFNELPDRCSDALILVCAGYAAVPGWGATLGWLAAALALLTAYVRALAGSLGVAQDFGGPMAKQRRMDVISGACLLGAALAVPGWNRWAMAGALAVVAVGSAITVVRRTLHLVEDLEAR